MRLRYSLILSLVAAVAVAALSIARPDGAVAGESSGLQNAGFEDGTLDGAPAAWQVVSARDAVRVVDEEGPAEFETYAEQGITVSPASGDLMLRLGTPKQIAQSQNRGDNTVSQTFLSDSTELTFAMRVFSWEHRGDDIVSFTLTDPSNRRATFSVSDAATGDSFTMTMPDGSTRSCAQTPCSLAVDVGERQQFLNTGWIEVRLSGLPDDGRPLTLQYGVRGGNNNAHATWAYFDNGVTPPAEAPVARFSFAPSPPLEGDFVQFIDQSTDADGDIVSWQWDISGPGVSTTMDLQHPVFSFPDEGTFVVRLTVTDATGARTTVESGTTADDGTPIPALIVGNADARVNALNVEVMEGEEAPLTGRFADPGWQDAHTAEWAVAGGSAASLTEEQEPAFSAGLVTGTIGGGAAGDVINGTLTVSDNDGGSGSDGFEVRVLGGEFDRREPNDSPSGAPVLAGDWRYISDLSTPMDVDVFEVVSGGGGALEPGSEVLVKLDGLDADYDIAILSPSSAGPYESSPWLSSPWFSSPWLSSPWLSSPWLSSPWLSSPWLSSPWLSSPWLSSPWLSSPWLSSPWLSSDLTFDQIALSELEFGIPGGEDLNGADVSLVELGLGSLADENLQVVGHSANRGTAGESVLVRVPHEGQRIFVAVFSYNGAYTPEPYALTIETSRPIDLDTLLPEDCFGSALVPGGPTAPVMLYDHPGVDRTLIVTQRERLMALYDMDDAEWAAFLADLIALANHELVAADIVSVPSSAYDAWDSNPCSIDAANATTEAIRSAVVSAMDADANKRFVVIAGNDDVIPYRRVPDGTSVGNEREYLLDSFVLPGTPTFASMQQSQFLTDDFYGDPDPQPWQGRELYVPQWELGRLVETPAEIRGAAQAFLDSDGRLEMSTALVTGYDFFNDGAGAVAERLSSALDTRSIISDDWTSDTLRCFLLGEALAPDCTTHDVNAPFAHFTHYGALAAHGFHTQDFEDYIDSTDVADAGGGSGLRGALTFTIGCHAGMSVPDRAAVPVDAGLPVDPKLDLAQAMARQRAVLVGNTGFGLGDSEAVAGNEELMAIFAAEVAKGGPTGVALRLAKQQYLLGLASLSVYEEKASVTTTFYGLPQYEAEAVAPPATISASPAQMTPGGVSVTIEDGGGAEVVNAPLNEVVTDKGTYFSSEGVQASPGRPIQPRLTENLAEDDVNGAVHGVVVLGGAYGEIEPFDPVIAQPQQEWQVLTEELQACIPSFWPTVFASVNSLDTPEGLLQSVVVVPAQFRCTSEEGSSTTGLERVFTDLTLSLRRSHSDDFAPPVIHNLDIARTDAASTSITVDASDDSGIAEIVVYVTGGGVLTSFGTGPLSGSGPFSIDVPVAEDERFVVQVVDGAGNVSSLTAKGIEFEALAIEAIASGAFVPGEEVTFTTRIEDFDESLAGADASWFVWDFGDGTFDGGLLAENGVPAPFVTVHEDGSATFEVTHIYGDSPPNPALANVTVADDAGRVGMDNITLSFCGAPLTSSDLPNDGSLFGCVPVLLNVMPGGSPTSVLNVTSGAIPAAVMTTDAGERDLPLAFDAATIIATSVRFGARDAVLNGGGASSQGGRGSLEDVQEPFSTKRDGDLDMIMQFPAIDTGLQIGDTEACVIGQWVRPDGSTGTFFGCAVIRTE